MLNWRLWDGDTQKWDKLLQSFDDYSLYQSSAWGEHRSRFGWSPNRFQALSDGVPVAMAQVLVRKYPLGFAIAWIPGGPVGDMTAVGPALMEQIRVASGARFLYCRFSAMRSREASEDTALKEMSWHRTSSPLLTGLSLTYEPSLSEELRLNNCSGNWRHNLRRSMKRKLKTYHWVKACPQEMMAAYAAMQDHKQLAAQTSGYEIESLLKSFGSDCVVVRCDDEDGNLLAFRGALVLGAKAVDIFAVAIPAGRKVYASHSAFWELMKQCAAKGVQWYDMSGADPEKNKGVYDFKKGTGAKDIQYLGEWECAKPALLRGLVSRVIRYRGRA